MVGSTSMVGRVEILTNISRFESISAGNVISAYRDKIRLFQKNPAQKFELVSSHGRGVKGDRRNPSTHSANSQLSCNDTNDEIVPIHDFRYSLTGISRLTFPVLIIRTCEPVTFLYTSG